MKHLTSVKHIADRSLIEELFSMADEMRAKGTVGTLRGKVLASIFYEPSTRTRLSFESAMLRLGGQVITSENAAMDSSAKKGESLEDTIKVIGGYADVIVLRHPEKGAAERASHVSSAPIINAGDGSGEHPTQALLDLYTIQKELGRIDGLHITVVGDLLRSRTIHSLLQLLSCYKKIHVTLVSPQEFRINEQYIRQAKEQGIEVEETADFTSTIPLADVLYMNRVQKERFEHAAPSSSPYTLNEETIGYLGKDAIILDPLPRVDEIAHCVDSDPRAAYFRQAANGVYVRMALLHHLFT